MNVYPFAYHFYYCYLGCFVSKTGALYFRSIDVVCVYVRFWKFYFILYCNKPNVNCSIIVCTRSAWTVQLKSILNELLLWFYALHSTALTDTFQIIQLVSLIDDVFHAIDSSIYSNKHINFIGIEGNSSRFKWRRNRFLAKLYSLVCLWSYQLRNGALDISLLWVLVSFFRVKLILMTKTRNIFYQNTHCSK